MAKSIFLRHPGAEHHIIPAFIGCQIHIIAQIVKDMFKKSICYYRSLTSEVDTGELMLSAKIKAKSNC